MKGSVCCSEIRKLSILAQLCPSSATLFSQGPKSHWGMDSWEGGGGFREDGDRAQGKEHRFQNQAGLCSSPSSPTR